MDTGVVVLANEQNLTLHVFDATTTGGIPAICAGEAACPFLATAELLV